MKTTLQWLAVLASLAPVPGFAINKCVTDGKTVYQDAPCEEKRETVAQDRDRQKRVVAYHRELDQLASQGHGLQRREATPPPPPSPVVEPESEMFQPKSRTRVRAERAAVMARQQEESERVTAESAARLTRMLDDMAEKCRADPKQVPRVGMSDAEFRNCTIHARFGGVTQVVAVERERVPLRLYIFPNAPHRVYSVDGVVTAIR
jgi:hypothetical protein